MPDYRLYIDVEYEAIERTLAVLPHRPLSGLTEPNRWIYLQERHGIGICL